MEKIAWIIGHTCLYWTDLVRLLAVLAAVFCFGALYLKKGGSGRCTLACAVLCVAVSLLLARLAHWYFCPEQYRDLKAALTALRPGDFALCGAFGGCLLAAAAVRALKLTADLPELLDCLSIVGCGGIAMGRLAGFFSTAGRGMILPAGFPGAVMSVSTVSGAEEWRLATFALQAAVAAVLFFGLLAYDLTGNRRRGDITLIFLLCYGASQVLLDSTRYDPLSLRSNGFISAVQLLSAGALIFAAVVFAVRLVKAGGWSKWYLLLWLIQLGSFGLAGYMEYYVQRHGDQAVFAYSVMAAALADVVLLALVTRYLAGQEEKKHAAWLQELKEGL